MYNWCRPHHVATCSRFDRRTVIPFVVHARPSNPKYVVTSSVGQDAPLPPPPKILSRLDSLEHPSRPRLSVHVVRFETVKRCFFVHSVRSFSPIGKIFQNVVRTSFLIPPFILCSLVCSAPVSTLIKLCPSKIQTKAEEEKAKFRGRAEGQDVYHQLPVLVQLLKFPNLCAHFHVILETSDHVRD